MTDQPKPRFLVIRHPPAGGAGTNPLRVVVEIGFNVTDPPPVFRLQISVVVLSTPPPLPVVHWSLDLPGNASPINYPWHTTFNPALAGGVTVGILAQLYLVDPVNGLVWADSASTHVTYP